MCEKITRDMHRRFADATAEEMREAGMCIICRHEMQQAKKLPCGHVLHFWCLRDWLLQQDWCPLCHRPVNDPPAPLARDGAAAAAGEVPAPAPPAPAPGGMAAHDEAAPPPPHMMMMGAHGFGFPPMPPHHQVLGTPDANGIPPPPHTTPIEGFVPPPPPPMHFGSPFAPFFMPSMMMMPPPPPLQQHHDGTEAQTAHELVSQLQRQMATMAEQLARLQLMLDQQQQQQQAQASSSSTMPAATTPTG